MARLKNMCPNPQCAQYGELTGILGGCGECGTGLVPYRALYTPPTTEQLARFVAATAPPEVPRPISIPAMVIVLEAHPGLRAEMEGLHRQCQENLNRASFIREHDYQLKP